MRIYIAGPMTGYPDYNRDSFEVAAIALKLHNHESVNPREHDLPDDAPWADHLRADLTDLLTVDAVAVLPGWECSRGASLEVHVAHALGMTVKPLDEWLRS
ncbi:MAG: DUF4406 domain-containing protein [Sphaerochaeta sp.]|jgi:hypothetical protein|nr:DUF4406 domain-containing protein [Sphaerochaeta sp.]